MNHFKTARPLAKLREGRADWYSIKNLASGDAEVMIYGEIGYFNITAQDFVKDLAAVTGDITLRLNSPGGEVFDGIAIYNALKQHAGKVTTQVDGVAASIASVIAMAGDRVVMTKNATMMIHDGHGLAVGNAKDMRELADLLDKTSDNIASIYADKAGGEVATWRTAMLAETWYSADEAVQAGLADEVMGQAASPSNDWDLSIFNYSGRDKAPDPVIEAPAEPVLDTEAFVSALKGAFA